MAFRLTGRGSGGFEDLNKCFIPEVRAYWEALRRGDRLPRREAVDPRGIANALEHSFLIERVAPGLARFRIAGSVFNDLLGMDVRGMPISALFAGDARRRLQIDLEKLFQTPAILDLCLTAERGIGRSQMLARIELLPLLDHRDQSTLALGCIETSIEAHRLAPLFSIAQSEVQLIAGVSQPSSGRITENDKGPVLKPLNPEVLRKAAAEPDFEALHLPRIASPVAHQEAQKRDKGVPYLRLVK